MSVLKFKAIFIHENRPMFACPFYKHQWDPFQPSMSNSPQGMKKTEGRRTVYVLQSKITSYLEK